MQAGVRNIYEDLVQWERRYGLDAIELAVKELRQTMAALKPPVSDTSVPRHIAIESMRRES
jgi:hypothetical protein